MAEDESIIGYWDLIIMFIALGFFLAGLVIYFYSQFSKSKQKNKNDVLSWLLISFLPAVFFFLFFKESTAEMESEIQKNTISISGAFAGMVIVWTLAMRFTRSANRIDDLEQEVNELSVKAKYVEVINQKSKGEKAIILNEPNILKYKVLDKKGKTTKKHIAIITGDILNVKEADVWVNSENTDMQMGRFGERSVSSIIRYRGAIKDPITGMVTDDLIAERLMAQLANNQVKSVAPGHVLVTESGDLRNLNNVGAILHVASVHGQPGSGYKSINRIADCVTNCLGFQSSGREGQFISSARTILFPLMGTGTGGADLDAAVGSQIHAAINFLQENTSAHWETIYFNALTDLDLAACLKILDESKRVEAV